MRWQYQTLNQKDKVRCLETFNEIQEYIVNYINDGYFEDFKMYLIKGEKLFPVNGTTEHTLFDYIQMIKDDKLEIFMEEFRRVNQNFQTKNKQSQ